MHPGTETLVPHNIVIEIDGAGVRAFGTVLGADFGEFTAGQRVRVAWGPRRRARGAATLGAPVMSEDETR